jgi:hypothetical protein
MDETKRALYFYLANQESINEGHLGEYVAISNNKIIGYYKDRFEGIKDMMARNYKIGSFNVTKCHPVGEPEVWMGFIPVVGEPL